MAADVYGADPHVGRGGWTWYTGSAGWMYRLIVESLLGLHLEVDKLRITPCLPTAWTRFQIHYRYRETFYHITIDHNGPDATVCRRALDGVEFTDDLITLVDDGTDHEIEIEMGPAITANSGAAHDRILKRDLVNFTPRTNDRNRELPDSLPTGLGKRHA